MAARPRLNEGTAPGQWDHGGDDGGVRHQRLLAEIGERAPRGEEHERLRQLRQLDRGLRRGEKLK